MRKPRKVIVNTSKYMFTKSTFFSTTTTTTFIFGAFEQYISWVSPKVQTLFVVIYIK